MKANWNKCACGHSAFWHNSADETTGGYCRAQVRVQGTKAYRRCSCDRFAVAATVTAVRVIEAEGGHRG
jgi:hypothetical protein